MNQNQAMQRIAPSIDQLTDPGRQIGQVEQVLASLQSTTSETERLIAEVTSRLTSVLRAEPPVPASPEKPQEYMVEMASALRSTLNLARNNNERLQSILDRVEL